MNQERGGEGFPAYRYRPTSHGEDAASHSPFRLIGIAMVVDHSGEGAKMLVRYPASTIQDADDVFYRMPGRQMAKLFRPKHALCDQPMTLSIGGTLFCCCAVLMDQEAASPPKGASGATTDSDLSLFSIIVALTPREISAADIPIGGWVEASSKSERVEEGKSNAGKGKTAESFKSIRRVHVSLARFCRVLKREEKRCRYVSIQSRLFEQIRQEIISRHSAANAVNTNGDETALPTTSPKSLAPSPPSAGLSNPTSQTVVGSPASVVTKTAVPPKIGHRRASSNSFMPKVESEANVNTAVHQDSAQSSQALEQEIIETIMVAKSPGYGDKTHEGNLALEMIQAYHALGRNDHQYPPTPEQLLSDKEGLVFVNAHIAVAMEPLASSRASRFVDVIAGSNGESFIPVRPYHTLLFPYAPPGELLESMSASTASSRNVAPRRLQQLLRMVNPQKSLIEIAVDTNLPIQSALDIATYLVAHGACLASSVINRKSVLACSKISRIHDHALPFSQAFGTSVNLFELISFVSFPGRTLGDSMHLLDDSDLPTVSRIRRNLDATIVSSGVHRHEADERRSPETFPNIPEEHFPRSGHLDEILFQMVVWLCSHSVLEQVREYLVEQPIEQSNDALDEKNIDAKKSAIALRDEKMLQELRNLGCLTGKISVEACCWKTEYELTTLLNFIRRRPEVRLIARVPARGDDWDAV